ncbi:caspase activity and apoptosis inhibitor 1 [Amia ocellicauda]|uniref:caspase activity and apoptosis inhibitor 1 n=1 Tax=Amia ocellicauda TaxID=2972642 RepID=UPI0034645ADF
MTGKKTAKDKKRKHSHSEPRHAERKRRSTESSVEDLKPDHVSQETDEPSDIEEGGLNLSVPFKPISAYVADRREMLEQCFQVLGETKLKKMLPDELKGCSYDEIKTLCLEQLQQLSQRNLLQILEGEDVVGNSDLDDEETSKRKSEAESQQDNNVDSTSSLKDNVEVEELKQGGASGEESDALSINADAYDSDIEGSKEEAEERKAMEVVVALAPDPDPEPVPVKPADPKKELQKDIEKSVSEILALAAAGQEEPSETPAPPASPAALPVPDTPEVVAAAVADMAEVPVPLGPAPMGPGPVTPQPSAQQLELLELEMRARAIKALMKANEVKKQACG